MQAFDADITIQRMQRSSYWPRPKYLKNVKSTYAYEMVEQEAGLNELDPLRQLLQLEEIPLDKLCLALRCILDSGKHSAVANTFIMQPAEIKRMWSENAELSAEAGTWTHLQCECILNGGAIDGQCREMTLFQHFLTEASCMLAFRTEWCIWATDESLAGSIDFVATNMRGNFVFLR